MFQLTCVIFFCPLGGAPNYYPNSFSAPEILPQCVESKFKVYPDVARYNSSDEDNFTQVLKKNLLPLSYNFAGGFILTSHLSGQIQGFNSYLCTCFVISGLHLLHSGAQWWGAPATLWELCRVLEGGSALHPETHGESTHYQYSLNSGYFLSTLHVLFIVFTMTNFL